MADDAENDDNWLYGENNDNVLKEDERQTSPETEPIQEDTLKSVALAPLGDGPPGVDNENENETDAQNGTDDKEEGEVEGKHNDEDSDKEDLEEDSDDDVNVVIGDIKSTPSYTALNIKRSTLVNTTVVDKTKQAAGKFNVEEFEQVGMINGVPAADYNLDSLEEKPWRKPGADITDYFNYGFNEDTWKAYCERQKRIRVSESGIGLQPLNAIGLPRGPVPISNDNSKYAGNFLGLRKAGPPPGRRLMGPIDVLGGEQPKENVIQVMTADRREYSRKPPGFPDMSVPPPAATFEQFQPEYGFNPEPEPYYGGYEPTQDCQWGTGSNQASWTPSEIKSLTPGPVPVGPPNNMPMGPPISMSGPPISSRDKSPSHHREDRDRDRDRDRERDRESKSRSEKPRDRDRERSHRRERSRSRSRRHKSRSKSPSHRSHRKKKSRRHEDRDSE
ncbi:hypothetical protein WA026_007961 [Henosepilachna vigintioctopunctata]|uniref:Pre-mRNA polyadenylation factor Fip1 domain-containing protein n=1 Tax=Henosepilachna vigintioctopunctata TaxID=420089 RepID=A0AAW1TQQ0_9CUCU